MSKSSISSNPFPRLLFVIAACGTIAVILKVLILPSAPIQSKAVFRTHWDLTDYPVRQFSDIQSERMWKMKQFCAKSSQNQIVDPLFHIVLTVDNVLSQQECDWVIGEIEKAGSRQGWLVKRNAADVTTGLDVRRVESLTYFAMSLTYSYIIPVINMRYGLSPGMLGVDEVYVLKSIAGGHRSLNSHISGGSFNFLIDLNHNFSGGGVTFVDLQGDRELSYHQPQTGRMVVFSDKKSHFEEPISGDGYRYVLGGQLGYGMAHLCDYLQSLEGDEDK